MFMSTGLFRSSSVFMFLSIAAIAGCGNPDQAASDGMSLADGGADDKKDGAPMPGADATPASPWCTDGVHNGSETDVDCGGPCSPCANTKACSHAADCASGVCVKGACAAPSCGDGLRNGNETDLDCGGACAACPAGQACAVAGDC